MRKQKWEAIIELRAGQTNNEWANKWEFKLKESKQMRI